MSAQQPVEIAVDAIGNYAIQRIPVRIDFTARKNEDPNHLLRPGLPVEPKVA